MSVVKCENCICWSPIIAFAISHGVSLVIFDAGKWLSVFVLFHSSRSLFIFFHQFYCYYCYGVHNGPARPTLKHLNLFRLSMGISLVRANTFQPDIVGTTNENIFLFGFCFSLESWPTCKRTATFAFLAVTRSQFTFQNCGNDNLP